jgi:membrane protein
VRKRVKNKINSSPQLRFWWMQFKKLTIPGFEKVPIYNVAKMFREEIQNDALSVRAAAISFYFIIALFPTSIFIFTLFAYVPIEGFSEVFLNYIATIMPDGTFQILDETIHDILNKRRGGWLSITFFIAFYFSINAIMNMMKAFDKVNPTFKKRTWLQKFATAAKINVLIIFQIIAVIAFIILSQEQLNLIMSSIGIWQNKSALFLQIFRVSISILTFFNTIALIYYFAPSVKKKYRYFSIGATFTTIALLLVSYLFSFYVKYMFTELNAIYGPLSAMIFIMIWVYVNALVLLFGFELNNSIAVNKYSSES